MCYLRFGPHCPARARLLQQRASSLICYSTAHMPVCLAPALVHPVVVKCWKCIIAGACVARTSRYYCRTARKVRRRRRRVSAMRRRKVTSPQRLSVPGERYTSATHEWLSNDESAAGGSRDEERRFSFSTDQLHTNHASTSSALSRGIMLDEL